jgi:hypothetical protein
VQIASTIQSRAFSGANFPGIDTQSLVANWPIGNTQVAPELGRNLSGNATTTFVNVVEPGTLYGDRINQVDLRVSKILRYGRSRTNVGVDIFNHSTRTPSLSICRLTPGRAPVVAAQRLVSARFAKLSVQIDF